MDRLSRELRESFKFDPHFVQETPTLGGNVRQRKEPNPQAI